jgi:hypothetical protein
MSRIILFLGSAIKASLFGRWDCINATSCASGHLRVFLNYSHEELPYVKIPHTVVIKPLKRSGC